jgi:hypothetical protein
MRNLILVLLVFCFEMELKAQDWEWVKIPYWENEWITQNLTSDSYGNFYVVKKYSNEDEENIEKYNSNGEFLWKRVLGFEIVEIKVNSGNDLIMGGNYKRSFLFDGEEIFFNVCFHFINMSIYKPVACRIRHVIVQSQEVLRD